MHRELIHHALSAGAAKDAESGLVATTTVGAVRLLLRELKPVIGELAACALYGRSLHLAKASFPRAPLNAQTHDELLAPLHKDLTSRSSLEAQRGSWALLNSLVDLLVSLIGEPLTYKLLRKAWGTGTDALVVERTPQ